MARISGRLESVGLGKETTRGTPAAPTVWVPHMEVDFDDHTETVQNTSAYGALEAHSGSHVVKQWGEGTLSGAVYRNSFGLILAALFGQAPTTTTVESTAKKHTYGLAQTNSGLSLTLALKDANTDLRFALAILSSLTIDYVVDDYVKFEATFISKKSASASNTVAYTAETKFLPRHAVIKTAATGSGNLGAASALSDIISLHLEFNRNANGKQALGSVDLYDTLVNNFEVTGNLEKFYNDTTYKDYSTADTHRSMRVDLIDTATTIGASTNPSLRFDFEEVAFSNWSKGRDLNDTMTESMDITALRNFSAGKAVTAELTNDTASY